MKFNSVASSRGDYPFTAITFGLGTSKWETMASSIAMKVRREGQGNPGFKHPVLFPKLSFFYDENLHGEGKELEWLFDEAIECSMKTMYPDFISLTGNGYAPSIYKKYGVYKEEMTKGRLKEQKILNDMNPALINHEFAIYLQPKYNIDTNEIIGAEALVRWIQGSNVVSPGEFIPIFEQNGFIAKLDVYVWEETLKYLKWRKDNKLKLFPISVNVSRAFLSITSFVETARALVKKYDIEPKYLELEITETIFADINIVKETVDKLRADGFKVLMDDFGSGYSSLNVLKDIEFDVVKIDLKFFSKTDEKSLLVIQKVIELCNELNIPAIAEGVETEMYVNLLKKYGCHYAQGYFYSKPIAVNDFNALYDK